MSDPPSARPSLKLRLHRWLKSVVMGSPLFRKPAGAYLRRRLHREYAARSDHYARIAEKEGLVYDEAGTTAAVRARLAARGHAPKAKRLGELHTFVFLPDIGWHNSLIPDLKELGPVTRFDYASLGYRWDEFVRAGKEGIRQREEMNALVLPALLKAHAQRPVDWVYVYGSGYEIKADTVRAITRETGLPTVNMCLDDKHSWTGRWLGDHSGGQDGIVGAFDLSWTTARVACEWIMAEGGRPLCLPEGFDLASVRPLETAKDIPVSFVGEAYGFRLDVIDFLRRRGVPVETFGRGWGPFISSDELAKVLRRSRINLGMGGILHSEELVNIKGRDFEIPAAGGGVYLTSFNPDLARYYAIGDEILCYRGREELVELIRYYLKHPGEAEAVAKRGRERCLREHRWLHRFQKVCGILGLLP
ncbi:MAG TPA: glycosyltransferase [Elusimicrobiota bacterium]|nr:glycosyltransferase [Elusimicrobiota bacterium]